ncbi:unnamed protein product [Hymenolepis diminuta]|uniref:Uncharacterized protein n=1 Tax=Hymenolepis diminuta TaxID=6216 RepID=A0A564XV07_HYMDI|nr:unnamed protein product [Hymenolepis diminuta]
MNEKHGGHPLAVYFQGRIYVVGYGENVDTMEMLDVAAGGQWTSLNFYPQRFSIKSMARVGNELFVNFFGTPGIYSIEMDSDSKRQLVKWRKRKFVSQMELLAVHLK